VLSSLDEPLFQKFGGEKMIELMKQLGIKEDEVIGHSMTTKSIHRAQEKIAKHTQGDAGASSQEEWFSINMNKGR
jgi:preprotein translocase subunit SecA